MGGPLGAAAGDMFDVVIVGGGPAGSTAATLLRKYNAGLRVLVVEKARFPRDHIGESQLPVICSVLAEMGVWDKVEAAGFPVKLGASLTWGRDNESWDFDFYPVELYKDEPRPAKYEGQRRWTAFQVDRSIYDKILLDHAAEMGAEVRAGTAVEEVLTEGDRVVGLRLAGGETVAGRYYIDASGTWAVIRKGLGIGVQVSPDLKNIACWDYWQNAEWAVKIGVGATRIQVRSLPYGWIWFIPLGPTRTSIGLVCPADYYRSRGLRPEELYYESIRNHPQIGELVKNATPRGRVDSTKDWSTLSDRIAGENWFLAGEAAGFADPILSAGMTLAHTSARDAAYTILELDRGELGGRWLRERYDEKNRQNVRQHIRFAQYWYATNHCLTDLQEHCRAIAREAGLKLTPEDAWRWLAQGGFTHQHVGTAGLGSFDVASAKRLVEKFVGGRSGFMFERYNVLRLNLVGAKRAWVAELRDGRIHRRECYERAGRVLPLVGAFMNVVRALQVSRDAVTVATTLKRSIEMQHPPGTAERSFSEHLQAMEAMLLDGWIVGKVDPKRPMLRVSAESGREIRSSAEGEAALRSRVAEASGAAV